MPSHKEIVSAPERNREHNDCAVIATANVLDIPYAEAHELLRQHGRRNRRGTKISVSVRALKSRAVVTDRMLPRMTVAYFLRTLPIAGRFWLASTKHAFAYVDGELRDNIPGGKMRARMRRCIEVQLPETKAAMSQNDINVMWERLNKLEGRNDERIRQKAI